MDSIFVKLVERKQDRVTVRFEKASLALFLTQDYFEALSKTNLKAQISENKGKMEIIFNVCQKKNYEILEELLKFGQGFAEIKTRQQKN